MQHFGGAAAVGDLDAVHHHIGPLLAVAEIEILDLETRGQQIGQQRIGHGLVGGDAQRNDQRFAFGDRTRLPRFSVCGVELAFDADHRLVFGRRRPRHAGHFQTGVQRHRALRFEAEAARQGGVVDAAALHAAFRDRIAHIAEFPHAGHGLLLIRQQRPADARQRDLFLGAEVEPALVAAHVEFLAQRDHLGVVLGLVEAAFVGQRDHQRAVAQRAAVIAQVLVGLALEPEAGGDGFRAAVLVALQRQRQAQVHHRQTVLRLAALVVVERAQRTERRAVDAREHVAGMRLIRELQMVAMGLAVELVAAGQQVFVQALQGVLQHRFRHREAALARVEQELDDVRGQRRIDVAVVAPHREVAVRHLHRRQPPERTVHARLARRRIETLGIEHLRSVRIHHQRGEALAGGLFGAAVRILQHIPERARERNRRQRADCHLRVDRTGHQAIGETGFHRDRAEFVQGLRARAQHARPGRAHRHIEAAVDLEAVAVHLHADLRGGIALARGQREGQRGLAADIELRRTSALRDRQRAEAFDLHVEVAGLAGEVGDVEGDVAAVARRQHARIAGFGHDRRAHHHLGVAVAVAFRRIDQRRDPQRAVEVRHLQRDLGVALGVEFHRAGEQIDRLHFRGRPARLRQRLQRHVAAEADLADLTGQAFDDATVDIVGIHAEPALSEEMFVGVGHREAGDVDDADIDRRHRDIRVLAGEFRHRDRGRERLLRAHLFRQRQPDFDATRRAIHRHMRHAHGAGRGDLAGCAAAAEHKGGDVDVVTLPLLADRNLEAAAALHVDFLHIDHALAAFDHQQALARMRRRERDLQRVAGVVGALVERDLHLVGACVEATVVVVPAPAGLERITRDQAGGGIEDIDAISAPLHREIEAHGGQAGIDGAGFDILEARSEIEIPTLVVVVIPVVVAMLAHQRDLQPFRRARLAVAAHAHQLEARVAVAVGTVLVVEQRTHADQRIGRPHHPLQRTIDAAAAGFEQAAGDDRRDRRYGLDLGRQHDVLQQRAVAAERGIHHIIGFLRQLQGGIAEEISRHVLQRVLLHRHRELGGETVAGRGRAVQIGAHRFQRQRFAGLEHRVGGVEIELHALGQELLDPQGHALHGFGTGRIGAEFHLPAAGRRFDRNEFLEAVVALRAGFDPAFDEGLAVGLLQAHEQRLRFLALHRHGLAVVVAQQCGDAHDFTGAIEVASGPGEDIEPGGLAAADREFGQVQRRLVERQQRHVLAAARDQHVRGLQLEAQHRVAVAVGLAFQHGVARAVENLQIDAADRAAVLQRGGMHEQLVLVGAHVQADVADREECGFVLAAELAGALHDREVQTGLLQLFDVLGRQVGDHALVALSAEHETIGVDRFRKLRERGLLVVFAVQLPTAATAAALVFGEELRQRFLAHTQEFDIDFRHVHRYHRQAAAVARRQHAALRGETDRRVEFTGVDLLFDIPAEGIAVRRRELGGDLQRVLRVRGDEREAQDLAAVVKLPAALVADRRGEGDECVEVLGADQRPRELQRDRQCVAVLIGVGPYQGEFLDFIAFGLDGLAADLGQLPGFPVAAARHRQQGHDQPHTRNPSGDRIFPDRTANPTQRCEPRRTTHIASWMCSGV